VVDELYEEEVYGEEFVGWEGWVRGGGEREEERARRQEGRGGMRQGKVEMGSRAKGDIASERE